MIKVVTISFFILLYCTCSGQNNTTFIRHDTILLNASECEWLIKKHMPQANGSSVPSIILNAIATGKIKARDPQTLQIIPAKEILFWGQPRDTVVTWDEKDQDKQIIKVVQALVRPDDLSRIRVYHDWYLDIASGKLESRLLSVELMQEVRSHDGTFRGYRVFCRLE